MLGYQYTTEQLVIDEQNRLKDILSLPKEDSNSIITIFEHTDGNWYIVYNEIIAPYMPEPQEYTFTPPEQIIFPDEHTEITL